MNFWFNMQPFYNINNLNVYPDVNVTFFQKGNQIKTNFGNRKKKKLKV